MTTLKFLLAIVCIGAAFAAAPVAAQDSPVDGPVGTPTEEPTNDCTERVTPWLSICSYTYGDGRVTLIFDAKRETDVTITDAGGVNEQGYVTQLDATLYEGRNEVTISVTEVGGKVLATIDTDRGLYSPGVIHTREPLVPGPFDESDVQNAGLGGLLAGLGTTAMIAFRRVRGVSESPRRIL